MSLGYPQYRSNGERRKKPAAKVLPDSSPATSAASGGSGVVIPPVAFDWSDGDDWFQKLVAFFTALWAKILELEQKLSAAIERMATVHVPAGVPLHEKESLTTIEFAELSKSRPQGGLTRETIEKYCREGKLLAYKANGRGLNGEYRISMEEFKRWMNEGLRRPKPTFPRDH